MTYRSEDLLVTPASQVVHLTGVLVQPDAQDAGQHHQVGFVWCHPHDNVVRVAGHSVDEQHRLTRVRLACDNQAFAFLQPASEGFIYVMHP